MQRHGTDRPGPGLSGYLTEESLAHRDCVEPALLEAIDEARGAALAFFDDYDAILCPPSHALARPHGASRTDSFDDWSYMTVFNLLGWPGVSLRAGSSDAGLPVGVQIVAAPWREDIALALARCVEKRMGGFNPPSI